MDNFGISPPVVAIHDHELRESDRPSLNRLCNIVDWQAWGPLSAIMNRLNDTVTVHRVSWEYAMTIYGLEQLGVVSAASRALSIGPGSNRPLYYFANCIREVVAIDWRGKSDTQSVSELLTNPAALAPFPYRISRLKAVDMSPTDLRFESGDFDFVFALSMLDTLPTRALQEACLREMRRVLRPGGVLVLTMNFVLNGLPSQSWFNYEDLRHQILEFPGLQLTGGDLDLRIATSLLEYPVLIDTTRNQSAAPHIVIRTGEHLLTSLILFLQKH